MFLVYFHVAKKAASFPTIYYLNEYRNNVYSITLITNHESRTKSKNAENGSLWQRSTQYDGGNYIEMK